MPSQHIIDLVDWESVSQRLGIESLDPEALVHELAHCYDCVGEKAFQYVGNERRVGNLIHNTYWKVTDLDLSEIRVSSITGLVLAPLTDHLAGEIRDNLVQNLIGYSSSQLSTVLDLLDSISEQESTLQTASKIRTFLITRFPLEPSV